MSVWCEMLFFSFGGRLHEKRFSLSSAATPKTISSPFSLRQHFLTLLQSNPSQSAFSILNFWRERWQLPFSHLFSLSDCSAQSLALLFVYFHYHIALRAKKTSFDEQQQQTTNVRSRDKSSSSQVGHNEGDRTAHEGAH
mmetsp:Transcript_4225/g.15935  ORF Transcript_4225/g.15935 Transcript_4225/m.15935 type:complete len:139 (+) Transcript_4225:7799-8215(+)